MKSNVSKYDFQDAFNKVRPNAFSYQGLVALYDYLIEWENSTGEELELDVIAICCDFCEYESIKDFWKDYDKDEFPDLEKIREKTEVIMCSNGHFIIRVM